MSTKVHKRELTGAEIEHIRETLMACASEFDELFHSKDWFCTSVTDQIESSLEILSDNKNKDVTDDEEESDCYSRSSN
jgi:hypothetical protein